MKDTIQVKVHVIRRYRKEKDMDITGRNQLNQELYTGKKYR